MKLAIRINNETMVPIKEDTVAAAKKNYPGATIFEELATNHYIKVTQMNTTVEFCSAVEYFGDAATENDVNEFANWVTDRYPDVEIDWIDGPTADAQRFRGIIHPNHELAENIFQTWIKQV